MAVTERQVVDEEVPLERLRVGADARMSLRVHGVQAGVVAHEILSEVRGEHVHQHSVIVERIVKADHVLVKRRLLKGRKARRALVIPGLPGSCYR